MRIGIGYVNAAAVSPDGNIIAVGTSTGIYLYNANDLSLVWRRYTDDPVMGIEWSPDGTRLMLADYWNSYVEPSVWDSVTGRKISSLEGAWEIGAWSPDGQWIAATLRPEYIVMDEGGIPQSARVGIFYPETGKAYRRFTIDDAYFFDSVVWSLDGVQLAVRDSDFNYVESADTYLIDATSGNVVTQLQRGVQLGDRFPISARLPPDYFHPQSPSPDGTITAQYSEGTISVGTHTIGHDFNRVDRSIFGWFPDSSRLVVADSRGILIIDAQTGNVMQGFSTFMEIDGIGWLPDNDTLLIEADHQKQAWNLSTGTMMPTQFESFEISNFIEQVVSPDGMLIVHSEEMAGPFGDGAKVISPGDIESGRVFVTDSTGKQLIWERSFTRRGVAGMAWSPDGRLLALGSQLGRDDLNSLYSVTGLENQEILVVDALTGSTVFTFVGHSGDTFLLAFSPDGTKLATASSDGTVIVWPINY